MLGGATPARPPSSRQAWEGGGPPPAQPDLASRFGVLRGSTGEVIASARSHLGERSHESISIARAGSACPPAAGAREDQPALCRAGRSPVGPDLQGGASA